MYSAPTMNVHSWDDAMTSRMSAIVPGISRTSARAVRTGGRGYSRRVCVLVRSGLSTIPSMPSTRARLPCATTDDHPGSAY